ncbi:unnamed protein product (macronuclear) [Paramecium tetraurelia]|uniref:Uncharacterized protein n=1 Tax=Paramecium tetraurelia TaxID=5888 RepID=A0BCI0_PARTE|nr:uncharacterized protein GSPATT00004341001 [Paramecium tetraurelia]CAK56247.1 unnamed protein product [Paramecium tetraurelia]|eukprot:XP_001423645.1 hypothetical protein (macronuclear) [Paramecium tetraurelia strain d4-2]
MKIHTQKVSSHHKTDNYNNNKTFYNGHQFHQTLNSFQFKYSQIKEIDEHLLFTNYNLDFGNHTQDMAKKGLYNLEISKDQYNEQTRKQYNRRRVNTSYFVYPFENNRNLSSQNKRDNKRESRLFNRVQIPDTMKIPYLNKKNRLIKLQLQQLQNRQQVEYDDIRIASRISFHTKTKSNLKKRLNPNVNEQLQIIVDEHQSSDFSFINGWE